jgi:hypothetical protein
MARIQAPPRKFNSLALVTEDVDPASLVRLAWKDPSSHCRFAKKARYRFDAPDQSFGVLYAAFDVTTAFAETVLRDEPKRSTAGAAVVLDYRDVESRYVIALKASVDKRPLRLIKLYDEGLAAAGTDNQLAARDHYPTTQRWALAFHGHPVTADGIIYMSRYMGARKSVALFDRCRDVIAVGSATPLLRHPEFAGLVGMFNLGIDRP